MNTELIKAIFSSDKIIGNDNSNKNAYYISYNYRKLHKNYNLTITEILMYQNILYDNFKMRKNRSITIPIDEFKGFCGIKSTNNRYIKSTILIGIKKINDMFEKIMKFGWSFIVIFFVVMICIAMCSAYFATNEASSTPEITMMSSPKTLHISKFEVEDVLEDGSAVAHVEDYSADIDFMGKVLFQNDGTDSYVNDQIITAPKGKVEQIGTCKYSGNTIPVIKIIK